MSARRVPFMSLVPGGDRQDIECAIARVVSSGWFVLGPEVREFEAEFARATLAADAVGVGNGTDALALILRGLGIGPGDEVITTPLSAAYTALAVMMTGARPVFADIDERRLTLAPATVERAITPRTRAILPVHLYGQPADMTALAAIASERGLALVEDCCQAHLATSEGRPVGTIGVAGAFSFYPTKNLGALGDGGAVITNDRALADRIRRLRNGGQRDRYHHEEPGVNTRLDEMQAAILRARLPRLPAWTARRRALATAYRKALRDIPGIEALPELDPGHVYHLFVIRLHDQARTAGSSPATPSSSAPSDDRRQALQRALAAEGIETLIHYPVPMPQQHAFAGVSPAECPVATEACADILSLPLHPGLADEDVNTVAAALRRAMTATSGRA